MSTARVVVALVGVATAAVACGADASSAVVGIEAADGLAVEVVADDLDGPTQIATDGTGGFLVAELSGVEGEGTGRVVRFADLDGRSPVTLVEQLLTPTGVTVDSEGRLWIMEQRRLTVGPLDDPSDRTVVVDELPFNGRSEGTLTALDGGGVMYDTSGSRAREAPAELEPGSGTIWFLADPGTEPEPYATGFKHAYAHVVDQDGQLWSTEMSDGRLDGLEPPDELVRVERGDDFRYPVCVGDGRPVVELGADEVTCADTPPSHALFEPGATPTSVAVAPWDADLLVVSLWNRREIVTVPRTEIGRPHEPVVIVSGELVPQHLLTDGERLLVTDFAGGRILAVSSP